jgi:hypothetical protein
MHSMSSVLPLANGIALVHIYKSLFFNRIKLDRFGQVSAPFRVMHLILTFIASLHETGTLVLFGTGLIALAIILRRVLAFVSRVTRVEPKYNTPQIKES